MQYTFLSFIFFCFTLTSIWSQDNLGMDRENLILEYESYNDSIFQIIVIDSIDKIFVNIYGTDSLEFTHFMKLTENGVCDIDLVCDSMVIKLLCESCVEYHISEIVNAEGRKWKRVTDSLYISSHWTSKFTPRGKSQSLYEVPCMLIVRGDFQTQIILYKAELTKKKWKAWRRGNA